MPHRRLASLAVTFALMGLFIWGVMPGSGEQQFKRSNQAMQNARSWRSQTKSSEPGHSSEARAEVYCPATLHTYNVIHIDNQYEHSELYNEVIAVPDESYTRSAQDGLWTRVPSGNRGGVCAWGPRGTDELLAQTDTVARVGSIRRGDKRNINGASCRDWIASVPAPTGARDLFIVCIGDDDLPLEVSTPDRRIVTTYSDWNKPLLIEAPRGEDVAQPGAR